MVSNLSGSVGGQTFATGPGGLMVRTRSSPTQPRTPAQLAARQQLSALSKAWATELTDDQRTAWTDFAAGNPIPGAFGEPMVLTGIAMYNRLNRQLTTANFTRIDDPPATLVVPALTTLGLTITQGPLVLSCNFAPSPIGTDIALILFGTPPLSPGISNVETRLRQIFVSALDDATPTAFTTSWTDKFGVIVPVGTKVTIEGFLLDSLTGASSPTLKASDLG